MIFNITKVSKKIRFERDNCYRRVTKGSEDFVLTPFTTKSSTVLE